MEACSLLDLDTAENRDRTLKAIVAHMRVVPQHRRAISEYIDLLEKVEEVYRGSR